MAVIHPRERVARNFVKRYGMAKFRWALESFGKARSGQEIAKVLGVSRERVRQWRNAFGQTVTFYRLYPETELILGETE